MREHQEVCSRRSWLWLKFSWKNLHTFQSHSVAVFLKHILRYSLCPRYSAWDPAISIQKNALSERGFSRHPEFLLQFITTNEYSRASSVRAFVRNETIRMEATLRRTRSSIMRNAMSYRCAADNSSQTEHDRNLGASSSARRNDTQLDFIALLFVCGLKFFICLVIDREPMYDQPINDIDAVRNV